VDFFQLERDLEQAIANLCYGVVGLTEEHTQSIELAHASFPKLFSLALVNKTRSRTIDPDVREGLIGIAYDHALYREAQAEFARQWHCYQARA
jgi:hypothetical protein